MSPSEEPATRPGSALLDVVAVMDRLRSPGGCPWDAEQTHASLTRYLLEETYEVLDAVEALGTGAPGIEADAEADLAEELGDVLLQVVFHARVAAERGAFDVDTVATGLVDKLTRRHPHVFGDEVAGEGASVQARWDELKAVEKPGRGPVDGIPRHLPALARADKLVSRLERAGLPVPGPVSAAGDLDEQVGAELFQAVRRAREAGIDPEAALRRYVSGVELAAAGGSDAAH